MVETSPCPHAAGSLIPRKAHLARDLNSNNPRCQNSGSFILKWGNGPYVTGWLENTMRSGPAPNTKSSAQWVLRTVKSPCHPKPDQYMSAGSGSDIQGQHGCSPGLRALVQRLQELLHSPGKAQAEHPAAPHTHTPVPGNLDITEESSGGIQGPGMPNVVLQKNHTCGDARPSRAEGGR